MQLDDDDGSDRMGVACELLILGASSELRLLPVLIFTTDTFDRQAFAWASARRPLAYLAFAPFGSCKHPYLPFSMPHCFTLAYQSLPTAQLTAEALLDLLVKARQYNDENDITGLMLFGNGRLLQFLEGPEEVVRALYGRIELDPRHTAVTLLATASATHREFPDWSMATVRPVDALAPGAGKLDINRLEFILGSEDKLFYFKPTSMALIAMWLTNLENPVFAQLYDHPDLSPQEVIQGEVWRALRQAPIATDALTYEVPVWGAATIPYVPEAPRPPIVATARFCRSAGGTWQLQTIEMIQEG